MRVNPPPPNYFNSFHAGGLSFWVGDNAFYPRVDTVQSCGVVRFVFTICYIYILRLFVSLLLHSFLYLASPPRVCHPAGLVDALKAGLVQGYAGEGCISRGGMGGWWKSLWMVAV